VSATHKRPNRIGRATKITLFLSLSLFAWERERGEEEEKARRQI